MSYRAFRMVRPSVPRTRPAVGVACAWCLATLIVLASANCDHPSGNVGPRVRIHSPYDAQGVWYKANLHMHSSHSDGTMDVEPLVRLYQESGYQVLAITDHNHYGDQDGGVSEKHQTDSFVHDWNGDGKTYDTRTEGSGVEAYVRDWQKTRPSWMVDRFVRPPGTPIDEIPLLLTGFEASYSYGGAHFGVLGYPPGVVAQPQPGFAWLREVELNQGFVFIAHPGQARGKTAGAGAISDIPLERFHGVEIVNGLRLTRAENAVATRLWDALWSSGHRIWGLANDDAHERPGSASAFPFVAYNMILCATPSERGVLDALRAGRFYASTGLEFSELRVVDQRIEVRVPEAQMIRFVGRQGTVLLEQAGEAARYDVSGSERYVRVEAFGTEVHAPHNSWRRGVWSQPMRIDIPAFDD